MFFEVAFLVASCFNSGYKPSYVLITKGHNVMRTTLFFGFLAV